MQCLYNASQLLMVLNSQSECRQRCIATAFLKEKITEVFILKLLLIVSDLMWQVMRSCFRFDRNTKRVTWLFYYASICLFEQNNTTNHTASIAPASPQDGVITYTTICSSRQAASNPIGLNLHLFVTWPYWDIKISKPPYVPFPNMIELCHFFYFLGLSERYYNWQSLLITLYIYRRKCSKILKCVRRLYRDFEECEEVMWKSGNGAAYRAPVGANKNGKKKISSKAK